MGFVVYNVSYILLGQESCNFIYIFIIDIRCYIALNGRK